MLTLHAKKGILFLLALILFPIGLGASGNGQYRLSSLGTLEKRVNTRWSEPKGEGLALRWVYPFEAQEKRPLTGVASSLARPEQVLVTTSDEIYLSEDGGTTFRKVGDRNRISRISYFTSIAVSEENPSEWIVGTSFNGFHVTRDAGKTWQNIRETLTSLFYGGSYRDTINDMVYSLSDPTKVYFAYGVHGKLALLNTVTGKLELMTEIPEPTGILTVDVNSVKDAEQVTVATETAQWVLQDNEWKRTAVMRRPAPSAEVASRRKLIENKKGLYLTAWTASDLKKVKTHFEFIKKHGMDSVVIDLKEDSGWVMWDSKNAMAREAKAVRPILDLPAIRKMADEMGIHLIARFVVFKDEKLYQYKNNQYALWDKKTQKPWAHLVGEDQVQKEFWVDLFSPDVWDYNLALAKELGELGIDEIQFDYIRFPSDGPVANISSRHNKREMKPVDALESYLKKVRSELTMPISVDIYGYNGWFLTDSLGQNMDRLSLYVDAISPMTYPSHYEEGFLNFLSYLEKAKFLYQEGSDRAEFYTKGRTLIRQYVQAFLLGGERNFEEETYYRYLEEQIRGIDKSMGSGWILWNASNIYYMVRGNLSELDA